MAFLVVTWWWVLLNAFDVFKVFFLHTRKRLVNQQHVVHKLVPLYTTIRVCVNFHKQLSELLVRHVFTQNIFEIVHELFSINLRDLPLPDQVSHLCLCRHFRISLSAPLYAVS